MTTDRIFVLMLVIMLPMSGCFGGVGDAEAGDNDDNDPYWINERGIGEPNWNISLSVDEWIEVKSAAYILTEQKGQDANSSQTEVHQGTFLLQESAGWILSSNSHSPIFGGDYVSCVYTYDNGQCIENLSLIYDEGNIINVEWSIIYRIHSV
jgi:hypothetical protein|tara:strand:- start:200 stop:655 length:456 start_codon:yes stop_codon:yes gene_type:complete